jgi:hypothetical protein
MSTVTDTHREIQRLKNRIKDLEKLHDPVAVFCQEVLQKGDTPLSTDEIHTLCIRWCCSVDAEPPATKSLVGRRLREAGYESVRAKRGDSSKRAWLVSGEIGIAS